MINLMINSNTSFLLSCVYIMLICCSSVGLVWQDPVLIYIYKSKVFRPKTVGEALTVCIYIYRYKNTSYKQGTGGTQGEGKGEKKAPTRGTEADETNQARRASLAPLPNLQLWETRETRSLASQLLTEGVTLLKMGSFLHFQSSQAAVINSSQWITREM